MQQEIMLAKELNLNNMAEEREWNISQKADGVRSQLLLSKNGIKLLGRHSLEIRNYKYPEIITEAQQLVRDEDIILDGEIVVGKQQGNWIFCDFNTTATREHTEAKAKIDMFSRVIPATFFCFDIITPQTKDMPLKERLEVLANYLGQYSMQRIRVLPSTYGNLAVAKRLLEKCVELELEGLMLKNPNSLYQDGRSEEWLKWKVEKSSDFKVIGYTSKERQISALILENGKVNALIDQYWQDYILKQDISVIKEYSTEKQYYFSKPSLIAEIKFLEKTSTDALRFPVLKCLKVNP